MRTSSQVQSYGLLCHVDLFPVDLDNNDNAGNNFNSWQRGQFNSAVKNRTGIDVHADVLIAPASSSWSSNRTRSNSQHPPAWTETVAHLSSPEVPGWAPLLPSSSAQRTNTTPAPAPPETHASAMYSQPAHLSHCISIWEPCQCLSRGPSRPHPKTLRPGNKRYTRGIPRMKRRIYRRRRQTLSLILTTIRFTKARSALVTSRARPSSKRYAWSTRGRMP